MGNMVLNPIAFFTDLCGRPLEDGRVYIGQPNVNPVTNPLTVYQDPALTIPMQQPLHTTGGYVTLNGTPQPIYTGAASYSLLVNDDNGRMVLSLPNYTNPLLNEGVPGGAGQIGFDGTTLDQQFLSRVNRVVDSIAALRTLEHTTYTRAFVTGYYSAGDGGGGAYWYDAADTTSTDNGGTIIVAADGARWHLEQIVPVSICQFGAKGDATTDNTSVIQAAINALTEVFVPVGIFCVTQLTITKECNLFGEGSFNTGSHIRSTALTGDVIVMNSSSVVQVRGLYFDTAGSQRTSGAYVNMESFGRSVVEDCQFWNAWDAIDMNQTNNASIKKIKAFTTSGSVVSVLQGFNLDIDDIIADNPSGSQPVAGIRIVQCGDITIRGAKMLHCGDALLLDVGAGQFVNSVTISQSFFDTSNAPAVIRSTTSGQVARVDCTDTWFGNGIASNGVSLTNTGTGSVVGISFTNCRCVNNAGDGINVGANVFDIRVNGGQFSGNTGSGLSNNGGEVFIVGGISGAGDALGTNGTGLFVTSNSTGSCIGMKIAGNTTAQVNNASGAFKLYDTFGYVSNNHNTFSATTDANGLISIPHGLGAVPSAYFVQLNASSGNITETVSADATNVYTRTFNPATNAPVPTTPVTLSWQASI